MGTPTHTHNRSHLYTLVPNSFTQIELALRDLNFFSDGTPPKKGPMSPGYVLRSEYIKKKYINESYIKT